MTNYDHGIIGQIDEVQKVMAVTREVIRPALGPSSACKNRNNRRIYRRFVDYSK